MLAEAPKALEQLVRLGALVGDRQRKWKGRFGDRLPLPKGDRDIIAVHEDRRHLWIVEVEGDSAGQPEGKIYKALGQLVCALSESNLPGFERSLSLVVWGRETAVHLARASAVTTLGISGLVIADTQVQDRWLFGKPASSWERAEPPNKRMQRTNGARARTGGAARR